MKRYFLSVFILIWCSSRLLKSAGDDTIIPGQIIRVNQTITSTAEKFVLGFFKPPNSTSLYVGVWYALNKVPLQTVIWVANREKPITDSSPVLSVTSYGDLVILVNNSTVLWSSNSSNATDTPFQADIRAVLLDDGNVVLRQNNTQTWQSFDYPTDTFLPGMKIRLDLKTRKTTLITSWKDANNPAAGEFTLGIDPNWPASQLVIWRSNSSTSSTTFWRSGIWSGIKSFGSTDVSNYLSYLTIGATEEEVYITVTNSDPNIVSRFIVDKLGKILQLSWNSISREWDQLILVPQNDCDFYGRCGPSGSCNNGGCRCLEGYEPRIQKQGCLRLNPLECKKSNTFQMMERMKLPNFPVVLEKPSKADCEAHCLSNCSCTAYSFSNVTFTRCLIWTGDLIDLSEGVGYGQDFYLRKFGVTAGSSKKKYLIPVILSAVLASFLCFGTLTYVLRRRRLKLEGTREAPNLKGFNTTDIGESIAELPIFPFDTIIAATENFSSANKLGEGGFGPVYKGRLAGGQEIAVKRLSRSSGQGLEELKNEVELIAKLQHTNLVRLLGWCIHEEEKILIYEYMSNTSLDKVLFDANQKAILDWRKRFSIIEGIAQGILYLHRYSRLRIIHRDLKPSNILLDDAMNPKISDFGLARIFGGTQTEANTNRVVGTYGYMSPEYALDGLFSEKSDVFSFGVIVIELVSGKRSTGFYPSNNSINLIGYAWQLSSEGKDIELMDPSLGDSFVAEEVIKCIRVGLLCVQENAKDRPKMSTVVAMLSSTDSASLPSPTRPAFFLGRSTPTTDSSSNIGSQQFCSNEATMSQVEPR